MNKKRKLIGVIVWLTESEYRKLEKKRYFNRIFTTGGVIRERLGFNAAPIGYMQEDNRVSEAVYLSEQKRDNTLADGDVL